MSTKTKPAAHTVPVLSDAERKLQRVRQCVEWAIDTDRHEIISLANSIRGTLLRVERDISAAPRAAPLNSLGELQGTAAQFEAAVGRYTARVEALRVLDAPLGSEQPGRAK